MTPEERQELLAGYALGSLSEPDARAAERLVRGDAGAATELASYHEIVDLIALSAPLRRADPSLRRRVLRAARSDARGGGFWAGAKRRMASSAGWAAAAAAVVAAAVWISDLQRDIDQLREESASLTAVLQATAKEVATLSAASEAPAAPSGAVPFRQALVETIAEITTDPDATTIVLTSEAAGAAASGHYLYSEDAEAGLLVVAGLPPLPLGAVYQIWLEDSLRAVSGGVFTADANGEQTVLVETAALLLPRRISVRVAQGGAESAPGGLLILSGDIER